MNTVAPFAVTSPTPRFVILELFGGDNNLTDFVDEDLNEMLDGLPPDGTVLALTDHYSREAEVVELALGQARVLENWGEIDTGDPVTLHRFLTRALASYDAATPTAIGFWDHGSGVFDEIDPHETVIGRGRAYTPRRRRAASPPRRRLFWGTRPPSPDIRAMLHDDTNGGVLTTLEAGALLTDALAKAGRERVALIFSDTCLNGMVEVLAEFDRCAEIVVGSEDLEPGDGWDYHLWMAALGTLDPIDGAAMGRTAVEAFEASYAIRPELHPCTLGAFRTADAIVAAFKGLVTAFSPLGDAGFQVLDRARAATVAFARYDTYDLAGFAANVERLANDAGAKAAAKALHQAVVNARIGACALGAIVAGAEGLAFWFPSSRTQWNKTSATYARLRFDRETGWAAYVGEYR